MCFWACHVLYWVQTDRFSDNSAPTSLECFKNFTFTFRWWGWCQNKRIYKFKPSKSCSKSIHRNNPIYQFLVKIVEAGKNLAGTVNQNVVIFSRYFFLRVISVAYLHRLQIKYFVKFAVNMILIKLSKDLLNTFDLTFTNHFCRIKCFEDNFNYFLFCVRSFWYLII